MIAQGATVEEIMSYDKDSYTHISEEQFITTMQKICQQKPDCICSTSDFECVFHVFDKDADGRMAYLEFVQGISRMVSALSQQDKIQFIFRNMRPVAQNDIRVSELVKMVDQVHAELTDISAFAAESLDITDTSGNGVIEKSEFESQMLDKPILFDAFCSSVQVGADFASLLKQLQKKMPRLTQNTLHKIITDLKYERRQGLGEKTQKHTLSRVEFQSMLLLECCIHDAESKDISNAIEHVYDYFECEHIRNYPDMFICLSQALPGEPAEKIRMMFETYDADNSCSISKKEMAAVMNRGLKRFSAMSKAALHTIKSLDRSGNHDGCISVDEFLKASSSRELTHFFNRIFSM